MGSIRELLEAFLKGAKVVKKYLRDSLNTVWHGFKRY
jgi:hypothetical protein